MMDTVDRRILNALQLDATLSVGELAEKVSVSQPTCHRRLQKLRQARIIDKEVALIAPEFSPRPLTVAIEITLERQNERHQRSFETKMKNSPDVTQCYMVSGHVDYLVVVQVSDLEKYHTFVRSCLTADENVRNFRSMFVMKRNKFETANLF
jgi:Lrp/AsnC family leucine-responsive transcriptional regulator